MAYAVSANSIYNPDIFPSSMKRPIDRKCFRLKTLFENRMKNKLVNLIGWKDKLIELRAQWELMLEHWNLLKIENKSGDEETKHTNKCA